jgi:ABC-type uncharacterized transport system permease subunit
MMHSVTWLLPLLIGAWYSAVPIVFAAMAGVISERAGVPNIALEGFLLATAFAAGAAGQHHAVLGLLAGLGAGTLLGLLLAALTQDLRVDPIVSGLSITLFAAGATQYLATDLYPDGIDVTGLSQWPFMLLAIALPFACAALLAGTRFGLRLRSVGEDPIAARMAGISPRGMRYAALALSGAVCGLGGVFLSLVDAHSFSSNMSAGKGYIALALVVFGGWRPVRVALGALMFGFLYALQTQVQISNWHFHALGIDFSDSSLLDAVPYVMTVLVVSVVALRVTPPRALASRSPQSDT